MHQGNEPWLPQRVIDCTQEINRRSDSLSTRNSSNWLVLVSPLTSFAVSSSLWPKTSQSVTSPQKNSSHSIQRNLQPTNNPTSPNGTHPRPNAHPNKWKWPHTIQPHHPPCHRKHLSGLTHLIHHLPHNNSTQQKKPEITHKPLVSSKLHCKRELITRSPKNHGPLPMNYCSHVTSSKHSCGTDVWPQRKQKICRMRRYIDRSWEKSSSAAKAICVNDKMAHTILSLKK